MAELSVVPAAKRKDGAVVGREEGVVVGATHQRHSAALEAANLTHAREKERMGVKWMEPFFKKERLMEKMMERWAYKLLKDGK